MRDAVIVDAVRTPVGQGKPGGALAGVHPVDLLAHSLRALVERTGVDPALIDDVVGGCVDQVGQQAVHFAAQGVIAGAYDLRIPAPSASPDFAPPSTTRLSPGRTRC
jgi:acetyl-CoA acyltransferase